MRERKHLLGRRGGDSRKESLSPSFGALVQGLTPEELYRTQPHLRTVVDFVARNVAQLALKAYERVSDTDRRRLRTDPLALLLRYPNESMTAFELIEGLVLDYCLYERAYLGLYADDTRPSGWGLRPIPPSWVVERRATAFEVESYTIQNPAGERIEVPAEHLITFHGWNPGKPLDGSPAITALKQVLAEQVQAWSFREQVWQRGGRAAAVIKRPVGAKWSEAARERFLKAWEANWTGDDGSKAGGSLILEDGMTIERVGFSAHEDEWAEVSKVALSTVAAAYHVNPVMVGILDNANFSNTKEFRKMLFSETLGPLLSMIEQRLNTFLVPYVANTEHAYVEFNIAEKLQGDFETQAAILSQAAGAPWMTVNEARALQNMSRIDTAGADALAVPLNVVVGGQASPRDSGSQNRG